MALPTFDDDDDEEEEEEQSESDNAQRKRKKKKKKTKRKRKKEKKDRKVIMEDAVERVEYEQMEMESKHEIDIRINNEENMGFGSDELADDGHDLTKEEVTMTMNDLEMELSKHSAEKVNVGDGVQGDLGNNVDLSFLDNVVGGGDDGGSGHLENHVDGNMGNSDMDISNGHEVAGNGNIAEEE